MSTSLKPFEPQAFTLRPVNSSPPSPLSPKRGEGELGCAGNAHRAGFSLLEAILAVSILTLAMLAISQLVATGFQSSASSQSLATAQMLCDSKMAELAAGAIAAESVSDARFDEEPDWVYDVVIEPTETTSLLSAQVTVREAAAARPTEFRIVRLIPDPEFEP